MKHLITSVSIVSAIVLNTSSFATTPPTEGIVIYEWTGTVSAICWVASAYGINIGDQARYTLTLLDDVDPYHVYEFGSRYHYSWIEIHVGSMLASPDPAYNVFGGSLTMSNNVIFQGSTYDKIETYTYMETGQYGYLQCDTRVFFDPSAFGSNDLLLSTPSVELLLLDPLYSMDISNADYMIAESVFDTFTVTHIPEAADVNADAVVDVQDVLAVIAAFGSPCKVCDEDVNEDGLVNIQDLLAVISAWDQ